ncbi:hypothetical protein BDW66DRAFT_149617 [Aspergillus desertorum]
MNPNAKTLPIKPLYTLPIDATSLYNTNPALGITLIVGEGVNLAMWDSLLISNAIIHAFQESNSQSASFLASIDPPLGAFEMKMFFRARDQADETERNGKMLFGEDGAMAV